MSDVHTMNRIVNIVALDVKNIIKQRSNIKHDSELTLCKFVVWFKKTYMPTTPISIVMKSLQIVLKIDLKTDSHSSVKFHPAIWMYRV